ncbi:MAG: aspartyl protease family protein [Proteobacteria bacterium]|nr:aspartyl protease family protein [Pseudomonadota bacterium]
MGYFPGSFKILFILLSFLCTLPAFASEEIIDLSDPYQIMHRHYAAVGGLERLKNVINSHSEGRVHYDGLQGTFNHWENRPLQYRTEEDYSIISQIEGDSGEFAWFYDTNGQQLIVRDEETLKRRRISVLLDRYDHLDRQSPNFSMTFAGISKVKGRPCYEVVLSNTINSDIGHFFFDSQTLFMVRSLYRQPDMEIESFYDDYKEVNGIIMPFHQHNTFHPWKKTEETWTTSYTSNQGVDAKLFLPPQKEKGYHFRDGDTSATIPFEFIENLIYLPVTIGGDTQYWVLDSGASMSVIDQEYAEKHGLDVQGSIRGYGFGELFDLSFVKLPEYRVGSIQFASQKLFVSKGLAAKSYEPVTVGILGYDFLSRFVVEIDYDLRQVTFHDPESFVYKGSGVTVDAPLKYRTFALPVTVDGKFKSLWSFDLGSYHSSIHYPFAEKHGLIERKGVEIVSQGLSGVSREINIQFSCLQIDRFQLHLPLIAIPVEKGVGATALGEVGGNLGNSTLRHFHLFLNYPQQKIILEEGKSFNVTFPRDKSGLIIGRAENNQPMISYIASNSPAVKAGLAAGDIIVELAGQAVGPNHPAVPLRHILRGPAGSTIVIKVQREEQIVTTTLILEDLYPPDTSVCESPSG